MWGLLGGWCVRGIRWRANTLSHSHKWVTNWEPFGNVFGSFPKISFCRILGEDIYKMWEVLGGWCERRVRWCANTLSPAAQGRGRVLVFFFQNNGSQIGTRLFRMFLEAFQDITMYLEKEVNMKIAFPLYYLTGWLV